MPEPAALIAELEARLRPLEIALASAWWEASVRSSPAADRHRLDVDLARREVLADADAFVALRAARSNGIPDPLVARQIRVLYDELLPHQVPVELRQQLAELETSVESTYAGFRPELDGARASDNDIDQILRGSHDVGLRQRAWEAAKLVGAEVAGRLRALVRLRNEGARTVGHRDHFALALATGELHEDRLFATLDEVDRVTAAPFAAWKADLDERLAARFGIPRGDLRPWHYDDPFFQEPPAAGAIDLDPVFADVDLEALTVATYDGIGLDTRPVLQHSDLVPRTGKSQHAFCIDIDREGDVRVLCNNVPGERWMGTMLHEFGHAVYDRGLGSDVPWLLRRAAHSLTTEGIAMLFGRLVRDPQWLCDVAGLARREVDALAPRLADAQRAALLVFARWVLVMTHFERGLYADPDGDHDTRWWDLVEQYQQVRRPERRRAPDWAAKIHLAVAPVYYQNYLYGELVASQLAAALASHVGGLVGRPEAGALLAGRVFQPGASSRWDELVTRATGEPLTAVHLVRQLGAR